MEELGEGLKELKGPYLASVEGQACPFLKIREEEGYRTMCRGRKERGIGRGGRRTLQLGSNV